MTKPIAGQPVAHILIGDRERSLAFYRDTLGLPVTRSHDHGDALDAGGTVVWLTVVPDYQAHPHPVFGWEVADMDAATKDLLDRGVRFTIYEGFGQDERGVWTSPDGKTKVAWFPDPDGNMLSLAQV